MSENKKIFIFNGYLFVLIKLLLFILFSIMQNYDNNMNFFEQVWDNCYLFDFL